jgi:hypothetical protein
MPEVLARDASTVAGTSEETATRSSSRATGTQGSGANDESGSAATPIVLADETNSQFVRGYN